MLAGYVQLKLTLPVCSRHCSLTPIIRLEYCDYSYFPLRSHVCRDRKGGLQVIIRLLLLHGS